MNLYKATAKGHVTWIWWIVANDYSDAEAKLNRELERNDRRHITIGSLELISGTVVI